LFGPREIEVGALLTGADGGDRERVIAEAARLLRERGLNGVGVAT
jgi:hypothetical protein